MLCIHDNGLPIVVDPVVNKGSEIMTEEELIQGESCWIIARFMITTEKSLLIVSKLRNVEVFELVS